MAYVSPFGTRKNESGKEFIAPQRTNYVSPFKTSRVTAEYSSAYKKQQELLSLQKDFNNLENLPTDQQYRVSQRLKDAGYFTDEQKTQLDAAIKNSAARQQKGSASILEKAVSEVGRGAQRLYRNVTEVFTPTAIKNQLATSTRGATIPTTPVIKKPFDTKRIEQDIKDFTASPNLFIGGFNSLSALEQRDLINDLNTTVKEYAQSSNQDLADTAARAAILSKYLTTSTKDLEKENFFTDLGLDKDSLRPAYVKPDATKLGLDIAAGTVQQFKDAAYMFGEPLKLAVGRKSTADINLELYQQKKIDKNQYEVNKARIDDYFDRLVGTDTSTGTKLAKGAGWAAWAFSWYYPNSKALRVYQTSLNKSMPSLLKSFLGPVLGSGALNSLSTLTAYERGKKLSKAEFALNFGIGAANASIPFLLIGARRVKINRNLRAQGIDPRVMAGIDELDNAAQVNATTDEVLDILNEKDPAVREKMIEVAGSSLTKEEYAKYRANIDNLIKETDALNLKVRENVELELPETAATTAETTAVTTTTPTADIAVSPAKQLAEEITARNDLVLKPTGAKEGKLTKYNIVDGSGKVVGSLKAASQVKADAQFRAIKANPTRFSKAYPKVFQTIKEKAPTKAQVVKKAAPSVKEQPKAAPKAQRATTGRPVERPVVVETTRRAPAARPEAAPVKGRTEVLAEATTRARREEPTKPVTQVKPVKEPVKPKFMGNNSVVEFSRKGEKTKYILRSPEGKDIREITPSERKQFQEYTKARIEAYRASQGITKTASKLEAARAEAKLKERKAAEAQAKADAGVTAKKPEVKEQVYTTSRLMDKELKQGDKIKVKDTVYTYKIEQKKFQDPVEILDSGKVNVDDLYISRKGNKVEVKTQYVGEKPVVSMNKIMTGGEAGYFKEAPKKPKRGLLPKDQGGYVASEYPLESPIIPKNKYKVKTNMNATDELRADRLIGDYNARVADKTINPKKQSFESWGRDWWNTMWSEDKRMYPKIENVVTSADGSVISAKITYAGKTYEIAPKKGFFPKDEGGYIGPFREEKVTKKQKYTNEPISSKDLAEIKAINKKRFNDTKVKFQNLNTKVWGAYSDDLITISDVLKSKTKTNLRAVYNHESLHKAISRILSDKEVEELYRAGVTIMGGKERLKNRYRKWGPHKLNWAGQAEEHIADLFADYVRTKNITPTSRSSSTKLTRKADNLETALLRLQVESSIKRFNTRQTLFTKAMENDFKGAVNVIYRLFIKIDQSIDKLINITRKELKEFSQSRKDELSVKNKAEIDAAIKKLTSFYDKIESGYYADKPFTNRMTHNQVFYMNMLRKFVLNIVDYIDGRPKTEFRKISKFKAAPEEITPTPKKLTRAIAGKPEESVTKGAIRISYQALLSDAQNKLPHITELARFTPEQWKPYHDKYLKDFNTRPEYVDDVIAGRVQETGKFQRAAYTLLKEVELRNAATAEEWFRKSINTNIDKSPVYVRASESGQFLSLLSYFQKRYDLNSVISEIETARGKIAQKMYKTKGRELKAEIANQRKLILDEIAPVTAEDTANLIKSYKLGKKTNPLLKEFIGNNPITKEFKGLSIEKRIKLFTEMGSDQRLELLNKVVGEELALKFASDFERKLLLKNQKLGILNWIQNYKNVDPAIKRDLVSQLTKLERILVTNGVENQLDNYINTVLGIRPQMSELKTLFELNQKADKAHQAVLDKFGATKKNDDAWFYATDDPYYKPSKEELEYGLARAQLREYAMNMQKPTMKQEFEIWKNREFLGKVGQAAVTLGNWIRAFIASFDNSALGRQANLVLKTHPKIWLMGAKAGYTTMIRALKAKTPAELNAIKLAFEAAILADPWANDFAEAGLAILKADDMFLSSGPGNLKIKVGDRYIQVGKPLKASELAYDMTIQTMRLALAKKLYTKGYKRLEKLNKQEALKYAKDTDFTRIDMDPDFKRNLMVMINSMTGRGEFKSATAEKAVPAMNVVLFSTRWTKSQFDKITQGFFGANIGGVQYVVNGQKHWNPVQRMAAANLLKAFAVNASILAMAEMLIPGSTETNYRSADAGKIKIGTTRFDITGGMNQIMTLGARLFTRETKNSNTGVVSKLNSEEFGSRTLWNVLDDFFTNKLSPAAGEVARVLKGKDIQRADPGIEATLQRIITPMLFKNLFETGADPNAVPAWIAAFFDFNGISTNTYAAKGQGRLGNEWDNSSKGAVKAFRESVDKDVFAQAAAERDDLFNTFVVNLIKTPTYQNANDVDKKYILEKADAEIQERIFKKYGFKYKKQEVRTKQQTEQYKNLIKSNL